MCSSDLQGADVRRQPSAEGERKRTAFDHSTYRMGQRGGTYKSHGHCGGAYQKVHICIGRHQLLQQPERKVLRRLELCRFANEKRGFMLGLGKMPMRFYRIIRGSTT